MNRRILLAGTASAFIAGCSPTGGVALTPQLVIDQTVAVAMALTAAMRQISLKYPTLVPPAMLVTIQKNLDIAVTGANSLRSSVPATDGAITVKTVLGYVNSVLDLLAGPPINGLIPSPYNEVFGAAAILIPVLEGFSTTAMPAPVEPPAPTTTPSRARLVSGTQTTEQALATLQRQK